MPSKFLEYDLHALWRATTREIQNAGWDVDSHTFPKEAARPGGPTIYLCDYEAQLVILVSLTTGAPEQIQATLSAKGFTFRDACNALGTLMEEVGTRKRALDETVRAAISCAAGHYIAGTQAYQQGKAEQVDQYFVIRQYDASCSTTLLRPAATHAPGPLTPYQVAEYVLRVLTADRVVHPERFRKGQPLRFRPKPL